VGGWLRAGRVPGRASRPVVTRGQRLPRLGAAAVARDGEETLRIASRLQQERSILAKAIKEIVVDHRAEKRWLGNAREGGSLLFLYAPAKEPANRMVRLLANYQYGSLDYFGEHGVELIERDVGSTSTGLPAGASSGRNCVTHSCRTSGTQAQRVSMLRGLGAEPVVALPWRT
jgi:hypothetical protein